MVNFNKNRIFDLLKKLGATSGIIASKLEMMKIRGVRSWNCRYNPIARYLASQNIENDEIVNNLLLLKRGLLNEKIGNAAALESFMHRFERGDFPRLIEVN